MGKVSYQELADGAVYGSKLQPATASVLGGVIIGNGLEVDGTGKISANVAKGFNFLFNPNAQLGFFGWNKTGTQTTWSSQFGISTGGGAGHWEATVTTALTSNEYQESLHITIPANTNLTLSGEIRTLGQTAGLVNIEVDCYNSSNTLLSTICSVSATNGQDWTVYSANGTTPTNTSYVTVRMVVQTGSVTSDTGFRRLKLEAQSASSPTNFSDDSTLNTVQWANQLINALLQVNGSIKTSHNTLDDGSTGKATFASDVTISGTLTPSKLILPVY